MTNRQRDEIRARLDEYRDTIDRYRRALEAIRDDEDHDKYCDACLCREAIAAEALKEPAT